MHLRVLAAAFAFTLAVAAATLAAGQDANPAWVRKPSPEDLYAVFPSAAVERGIDGKAVMECEIALDGSLRACSVVSETPPGIGFGAAALALAPQFKMRPKMENGQFVTSEVRIPISFDSPAGNPARDRTLEPAPVSSARTFTRMAWEQAPTRAEVAAAFPSGATESGYAMIDCMLRGDGALSRCSVQQESPTGKAFGRAALSLTDRFRAGLREIGGRPIAGAHVLLTVRFDAPGTPDPGLSRQLEWSGQPDAADLVFPPAARAAGVRTGKGTIDCRIATTGLLADCRLAEESPPGLGFGEAAMALAPKFRVNPWNAEGRTSEGRRIKLPIGFVDDPASPQPAPAQ